MLAFDSVVCLVGFGLGLGLVFTRVARGVAARVGMVDSPDGNRKKQAAPVPVAGGVAVLFAALAALLIGAVADPALATALTAHPRMSLALLAGAVLITAVGFVDDRYALRARYKLAGQILAVMVLVVGGDFVIHSVGLFGFVVELGALSVPFTLFWLLACVNALNLIDGMDGFLGTVGGIALVTLAVIAGVSGELFAAGVALALAGAVFGFLWWNLPPATIYMGDAGSMLIGFVIGAVAIPASLKGPATVALGAPLAVLVLPAFDTLAAVVRRKLTGRGLASPDRGHLHHKMMERGLRPSRVLMITCGLGLVAAAGALGSTAWNNDLFALVAACGVVAVLVAGRLFGNAELGLIRARVSLFARQLLVGDASAWGLSVRLQGTIDWAPIWAELTGIAGRLNLQSLYLDVNAPSMHENYHARWDNPVAALESVLLRVQVPLLSRSASPLGQLAVVVARDSRPLSEVFATVAELVEVLEARAASLAPLAVATPSSTTARPASEETPSETIAAGA